MGGFARLRLATGLAALVAALAPACTAEQPTQIVVSVNTDLALGAEVDALRLVIQRKNSGGTFVTVKQLDHALEPGDVDELPLTLALTRAEKGSRTVKVLAEARFAGVPVVRRQAVAHFVSGRILGLPLNLVAACEPQWLACEGKQQTCNDRGMCEGIERKTLASWDGAPPFDPAEPPPPDAGGPGEDGGGGDDAGVDAGGPVGDHVIDLALGRKHSCALWASGVVQCWGGDDAGQLSNEFGLRPCPGPRENLCAFPRQLDIPDAVSIAAGDSFSCAVTRGGQTLCWGSDELGELGDGEPVFADGGLVPSDRGQVRPVVGAADAEFVTAGAFFACAAGGALGPRCWGDNSYTQLREAAEPSIAHSAIKPDRPLEDATASMGDLFACSLVSGAVVCWGDDHLGQGGEDAAEARIQEVAITGGARSVTAGPQHACALLNTGEVRCWGRNDYHQVGVAAGTVGQCDDGGIDRRCAKSPQPVGGDPRARALALGALFSCLITDDADAQVECWGDNRNGAIDATNPAIAFTRPVPVAGLKKARLLAAGRNHACAVIGNSDLYCWGSNEFGQLGPNATLGSDAQAPARVELPAPESD
jgi:alpha-tubulin suppressor-like RCC1 family protein